MLWADLWVPKITAWSILNLSLALATVAAKIVMNKSVRANAKPKLNK
jgi:hypothetical protein